MSSGFIADSIIFLFSKRFWGVSTPVFGKSDVDKEPKSNFAASIYNVLSGRCQQAHGSYWTYKNEPLVIKKSKPHRKYVYQFDLEGNIIKEFESARNADRFYNLPMGTVASCANKNAKRKRVGQYIFSYEPELDRSYYNIP